MFPPEVMSVTIIVFKGITRVLAGKDIDELLSESYIMCVQWPDGLLPVAWMGLKF